MSLLREGMLVNGHVYSTGTGQVGSENAPKIGALTSPRSLIVTGCLAVVITPCAMVDARSSLASQPAPAGVTVKILVLGGDGYLGWPTALHLSGVGHHVSVLDNFARRGYDFKMGVDSPVPIETLQTSTRDWHQLTGTQIGYYTVDLTEANFH